METNNIPILPADAILDYEAEGAANIVYEIKFRPKTPLPSVIAEYGGDEPMPEEIEFDRSQSPSRLFESKPFLWTLSCMV